jgi:hypothetical protein
MEDLSATGLRPGGKISTRSRPTTRTGTPSLALLHTRNSRTTENSARATENSARAGTNDGDTISILSMQDSEELELPGSDVLSIQDSEEFKFPDSDGIQSVVASVRSLGNSRKETISVFSLPKSEGLLPYPGAADYGAWLENQFNNNIIPYGTACLLREMHITDDKMIQFSQDVMTASDYLEILQPELYEKSRGVLGEIRTIWRFIKLMQHHPNIDPWSYNAYLAIRTKYKRLDQQHYPSVSYLRQHDHPTPNDEEEEANQSDKKFFFQNELETVTNQDEDTHCHYRSNNPPQMMSGEEHLGDNSWIWGDGTSVPRERKELPEEKENVLMSDEHPYFLKQHWRQRVSNPPPLKGHRNPRVREKKVSQKHQEEQMYKIKDYLQDKEYSSHSKRSKLSNSSSRSNQFKQNTPRSRPILSDKITWNGKRTTFKQYSEAIEGHILQVGGGYLINKEFIKKYKIFAERGEDYFMSGSFTEDYCDVSSSQACLDRTYLYGMLLSSNRRGGERHILLKYKNKHDGIMAWIEFNEKYAYNGSEEVRVTILEKRVHNHYPKDTPNQPPEEYLADLQADLQELNMLLPEEYMYKDDSRKCKFLYKNMMYTYRQFDFLLMPCLDSGKTFEETCRYLRSNFLWYNHHVPKEDDSDSDVGQMNRGIVQQESTGDSGCDKTGEVRRNYLCNTHTTEDDSDSDSEDGQTEDDSESEDGQTQSRNVKPASTGDSGCDKIGENTHSGVCEKTKEKNTNSGENCEKTKKKNTNSGENKEKGKNTSSGESRETGEDITLGGSYGYAIKGKIIDEKILGYRDQRDHDRDKRDQKQKQNKKKKIKKKAQKKKKKTPKKKIKIKKKTPKKKIKTKNKIKRRK